MNNRNLFPSLFTEQTSHNLFNRLNNEMARFFDDFDSNSMSLSNGSKSESLFTAKMDCSETDDAVELKVEVPGVSEKDIDVELNGRQLTISGKRESSTEDKKKNYRFTERETGSFLRRLNLDFDADPGKVKATVDAGILTVSIEKPEESKARKQKITVNPKKGK